VNSLDDLYARLDALNMESGWHRKNPALWAEPHSAFQPIRWQYEEARVVLDAAGRLMDTTIAERRNLTLTNPCENNTYATLRTMVAAYQMMLPGEQARSHRHTPNALRVILEGEGSYTIVNGERLDMHPGDIVLTPGWSWHAHVTEGATPCYWIDVLDVPLIHLLETMFYEPHPDSIEIVHRTPQSSALVFPMSDIQRRFAAGGKDAVELGNPALSTLSLRVEKLADGTSTALERTTANNLFVVLSGSGVTDVEGTTLDWKFGDIVAVPIWRAFTHRASADAMLLRASDEPVQRVLGLLRTHG
jgi:gentisate 1,2-dioxygenase